MADFIYFEADGSDESNDEGEQIEIDNSLIDDSQDHENNDPTFFRFHNQTRDIDEALREVAETEEIAAEHLEANNYIDDYYLESLGNESIDDFVNFEEKRDLFLRSLKNPVENRTRENSFYLALLYSIRFLKTKKSDLCEEGELENQTGSDFYSKMKEKKESCVLDQIKRNFDTMCFDLNEILVGHKFFLRVYELKDKFRYLLHENYEKKEIIRKVSSCIKDKFNGFTFAQINLAKNQKQDLIPINIVYKLVKKQDEVINCFFTDDVKTAFRAVYNNSQGVHTDN